MGQMVINIAVSDSEIPNVLVGQAIEYDLCVQGPSSEDIVMSMANLLESHMGMLNVSHDGGETYEPSENDLSSIPPYIGDISPDASVIKLTLDY